MDENLHNDKLDEFVNRSFEQYSEDPSDSVWDAIDSRLGAPAYTVVPNRSSQIWKYAAVLTILLLSAALINQHYGYKRKLAEIKMTLPVNNASTQTEETTATAVNDKSITKTQENTIQETKENSASTTQNKATIEVTKAQKSNKTSHQENRIVANTKSRSSNNSVVEKNNINEVVSVDKTNKEIFKPVNTSKENEEVVKEGVAINNTGIEKTNTEDGLSHIETLDPVPSLHSTVFNKQELSGLGAPFVLPAKKFVPNMYASVMLSPSFTYEIKNSKPSFDPMHQGQVNNEQVGAIYSNDLNLRIGANLSSHWGIETGAGYIQMNRVAVHKPQFKFKDHHGGPGGPGGPPDNNHYFDFNYGLNTFGGSTNIEVRVENVDTSYMFKDDDQINLDITTNEKVEILRIPLVGVYKFPMGRFGLIMKGGFVGNFLLKNELQITGLNTNNVKLKDKEDNHHQRPPIQSPSKFQLGYLASAGAYYNLTRNLSVIAEPYISGNLSTTNCNGSKLPSYYSIGLNTGLTYNF